MAYEKKVFIAVGSEINDKTVWTTLNCSNFETTYGVVSKDPETGSLQPILGPSVHVDILAVNKTNNTAIVTINGVSPTTGVQISREVRISLNKAQSVFLPELGTSIICGIADLDCANANDTVKKINKIAGTDFTVVSGDEPSRGEDE